MPSRLARHVLRAALCFVAAIAALYLVGANLVLNTDVLDDVISKRPQKSLVEWQSGWTLLPGVIHVEGFRVRGQSRTQQWEIRLSEADVRISLLPLLRRRVEASRVRGSDFRFRQRRRLDASEPDAGGPNGGDTSHHPPIEGLANPPDPVPEEIYPAKKTKRRGWRIDIPDVRLDGAIELWVGDLRLSGNGRVDGGIDYLLRDAMHVPRALFDLADGRIEVRGVTFATDLDIVSDARLGPFVPTLTHGLELFDNLVGSWRLENGTVPDITVLNAMLPGGGLELTEGSAGFSWSFDKPSVEAGSNGRMRIVARKAGMLMGGRSVSGDVTLDLRLERGSLAEGSWELGETVVSLDDMDLRLLRSATSRERRDEPWWARFRVASGRLEVGEPSKVTVDFEFELLDTEPLLSLFLAKQGDAGTLKLPIWAKAIPGIRNVTGRGFLDMEPDRTLLDKVLIDGDHFGLTAWLEARQGVRQGKLYMRYKKLDLGIERRGDERDFKILRPKSWARRQPELDQSVVDARRDR